MEVERRTCPGNRRWLRSQRRSKANTSMAQCFASLCPQLARVSKLLYDNFTEGKKDAKKGRMNQAKAKAYVEMIKEKNKLFDMFTEDPARKKLLEGEWGVKMGKMEIVYLEDQGGPRLMSCDHGIDPVFYRFCLIN